MFLKPQFLDEVEDENVGVGDPQPEVQRTILDQLTSSGRDVSGFKSDEEFIDTIGQGYEKLQKVGELEKEVESLRPVANEYYQHHDEFEELRRKREDPEPEAKPLDPEQIDRKYLNLLEKDQKTGFYRAPREMPELASVARKANARQEFEEKRFSGFRENPGEWVAQLPEIDKRFDSVAETVEKKIWERLQQDQSQREQNDLLRSQENLFEVDEFGQPQLEFNPQTQQQQFRLSNDGRMLNEFVKLEQQRGTPQHLQLQMAMDQKELYEFRQGNPAKLTSETEPETEPASESTPLITTAEEKKREFLDSRQRIPPGAGRSSSRAGGELIEDNTLEATPTSFMDIAKQVLRKAGLSLK